VLSLLLAASVVAAQQPSLPECFDPEGYLEATKTILCNCGCPPQSVHDCACGHAAKMRREIQEEMAGECLSGEAMVARYVERFGEQIRIAPAATGFNLVAWLGPAIGTVIGIALLILLIRRWARQAPSEPEEAPAAELPAVEDDAYRRRLQQTLEGME
jgi:cytochrome c-type biogenesis protein CcmH/NrfF